MTNFALQLKGEKFRKRTNEHLLIIWIERIPLLQVYFSHVIVKQDAIFKDICFKQSTQFCSAWSIIGLIYCGPANWSFGRQIPCSNYFIIISIYYQVFLYFFSESIFPKKNVFFLRSCIRKLGGIYWNLFSYQMVFSNV